MSRRREYPKRIKAIGGTTLFNLDQSGTTSRGQWLWAGRIPLGKLTVLDGDPGMGKSFITLDLAARVSMGLDMPDGTRGVSGGVVLLCAEDDLATTVSNRLASAGANPSSVYFLNTAHGWNPNIAPYGAEDSWTVHLPSDIQALRTAIEHIKARLVVIDPLVAFLDASAASGREQDMYEALGPLARLAENTGVAMLLVRHLTKSRSRDPLHWGAGSLGIAGRVRAGLLTVRDPDNPEHGRLLVSTKSNIGPAMPSLRYRIVASDADGNFYPDDDSDYVTDWARVQWLGPSGTTAVTLKDDSTTHATASARAEAETFLRETLREGSRPANEVLAEAHSLGISTATLRRARADMGVRAEREGFGTGGRWLWSLPPEPPATSKTPEIPGVLYPYPPDMLVWEEGEEEDDENEEDAEDDDHDDAQNGEDDKAADDWKEDDAVAGYADSEVVEAESSGSVASSVAI